MRTTAQILRRCDELGFARAGVCAAEPTRWAQQLRAWLAAGQHGEMDYLARQAEIIEDPRRLVEGARSIICVADRYADGAADAAPPPGAAPRGRIARYARGQDYHRVIRKRLHRLADELRPHHPGHAFRSCVDTAPLLEREHAQRAGLGAVGKHTLLIEQGVGSYLLLGAIVTTLPLDPTTSAAAIDPCGTCTRCIDACPTGAIAPWKVDATRCISYLTIEHRAPIDPSWFEPMGDWLFGCDVCQEVCPHNQPKHRTQSAPVHDAYAPRRTSLDLLEVLAWGADERREAFTGTALKRARLSMIRRNAVIAAGNALRRAEDPALRARLEAIARDDAEDPLVRETARALAAR